MKNKHVSDYDIQQFVFDAPECKTEITEHISSCGLCKKRVGNYSALSNKLKSLPEPDLGFDLSDRVLKQLETTSKKKSTFDYVIYLLITLSLVVVITCLLYFKGAFIDVFKSNSAISTALIISTTLLISLVMAIDMIRFYNKKINMLDY